jgi:hypothetical protein
MPLYTPIPEYWYPEWKKSMAIHHTFKDTYVDNYSTLHGYISRPVKDVLPSDIIILYLHGNAGNIYHRIPHFNDIIRCLDDAYPLTVQRFLKLSFPVMRIAAKN